MTQTKHFELDQEAYALCQKLLVHHPEIAYLTLTIKKKRYSTTLRVYPNARYRPDYASPDVSEYETEAIEFDDPVE